LPNDNPNGTVNRLSVFTLLPDTSLDLAGRGLLTTGIEKAFAASGDITKDVLPKSSVQCRGNYFPS
jgi:hypothetical protein